MNKFAHNISAYEAEKIIALPSKTALISINEEDVDLYPLNVSGENVLRLRFADLRSSQPIQHKGKWYRSMSLDKAHEVINFIARRQDYSFIVHCAAGISRSSALCMYLHIVYGHELKPNFYQLSDPNTYVLGLLLAEHYRKFNL